MSRSLEEGREKRDITRASISVGVAFLFVMVVPGMVSSPSNSEEVETPSSYEANQFWKSELTNPDSPLSRSDPTLQGQANTQPLDPYPRISDDGRPFDFAPSPTPLGTTDLVFEDPWQPPSNTGGGFSTTTQSLGEYQVGVTHEMYVGDQNGDGVLEWVVYYFYRPNSINGIDDDGDGCVDELTYGTSTGQIGCDLVSDAMVYFETGWMAILGGSNGDVVLVVDYFNYEPLLKLFKIDVTPRWSAYKLRGFYMYPQFVGDFISYYSHESLNGVNANPEMDNDMLDYYVGNIDVRGFPNIPPVDQACSAGYQIYIGASFQRDDGWVVTSYELWEWQDANTDWNGDGDSNDYVTAYYVVDPVSGNCRQGVNGGVSGEYPSNAGSVMTPGYTFESNDNRDWNGDGDTFDGVMLWHNIDARIDLPMSWPLVGPIYKSSTYTSVGPWGNGWWGRYATYGQFVAFPMKFGGTFYLYHGYPSFYRTWYFLTADEDNSRITALPRYEVGYGKPAGIYGGKCVNIFAFEQYLRYAGVDLDCNGDGDYYDTCQAVFCPNETGGGGEWVTLGISSPYIFMGTPMYHQNDYVVEDSLGQVAIPFSCSERDVHLDLDGNLIISSNWIHLSYLFTIP